MFNSLYWFVIQHHAKIEFTGTESHKDDPSKGYTLVDLGSRNGTYVDNVRLSSALQESEPHLLKHGTELRIGSTKLSVHIHNGRDTCDQCEPGVLISAMSEFIIIIIHIIYCFYLPIYYFLRGLIAI